MLDSFIHKLYLPKFNNYDVNTLMDNVKNTIHLESVQKITACALPILTQFEKTAIPCTYFCTTLKVGLDGYNLFLSITEKDLSACAFNLGKLALSAISIASVVFNWKFGSLINTSIAFSTSLYDLVDAIVKEDSEAIKEALFNSLTNGLYLAIYFTGSLELGLACIFLQAIHLIKDCIEDFENENYLELTCHLILLSMKIASGKKHYDLISKKNAFLKIVKFQKLINHLDHVRKISHIDSEHPLLDLHQAIEEHDVILDPNKPQSFGSYFFGFGEEIVKGMNLEFHKMDHETYSTKLNFSVNHAELNPIKEGILELEKMDKQAIKDFFEIFSIPLEDFRIDRKKLFFDHSYKPLSETSKATNTDPFYQFEILEVTFKGFGAIRIATDSQYWFMRSHIQVFLEHNKSLFDLHSVLSFVGLDSVLKLSKPEDFKRMEIGHLFRVFFPDLAHQLETSKKFFEYSLEELKQFIINLAPQMQEIFDKFLDKITMHEIFPGKYRVKINGLKDELVAMGAYGLTASIYDSGWDGDYSFAKTINILKTGMLSSEIRHRLDLDLVGLSVHTDKYTGGSDSVFTQMITEQTLYYSELYFQSNIRFLFDLEAIETSTYQYLDDSFGFRRRDDSNPYLDYSETSGIYDFTENVQHISNFEWAGKKYELLTYYANEIMIKERIPPKWITGIVVQDDKTKADLVNALLQANMIESTKDGMTILGKPVNDFIHVTDQVAKEQFNL